MRLCAPDQNQKKMKQIVGQYDFQVFLNDVCNDILENDALTLLRNLNHNQRKAIKVYPQQMRCRICSRPLYLSHGPIPNDSMTLKGFQRLKSELYKVWGNCPSVCGENGPSDSDVLHGADRGRCSVQHVGYLHGQRGLLSDTEQD